MAELTTLDRAIRLQRVDLFSDLETEMLALIASIAKEVELEEGGVLVKEEDSLDALYVVLAGRIEMRRGGAGIFTVGEGETIGNWALFERQPSVVTAAAKEKTSLLSIDREEFFDLLADHSEMSRELFQALFKRVRSLLSAGLSPTTTGEPSSAEITGLAPRS